MEYHLGERLFASVFPTSNGEAGIWVCSSADHALRVRRSQHSLDAAFETMLVPRRQRWRIASAANATRTSKTRGVIGLPNHIRHPYGPGWALVGDAG